MEDFSKMNKWPRRMTPEFIKYLAREDVGHVVRRVQTPHGTVIECDDYVLQATPHELEERKQKAIRVATQIYTSHPEKFT